MYNAKMKRVFTAINLPDNLKQKLFAQQKAIKKLFPDEAREVAFKWVEPKNFHITLDFLGNIKEQALPALTEAMKKQYAPLKPFEIYLTKTCYDQTQNPRLIWVKAEGGKKQFHITLARIKEWQFKKINPEELPDIEQEVNLSFPVNSIEVMESRLSRQGPKYFILNSFKLI